MKFSLKLQICKRIYLFYFLKTFWIYSFLKSLKVIFNYQDLIKLKSNNLVIEKFTFYEFVICINGRIIKLSCTCWENRFLPHLLHEIINFLYCDNLWMTWQKACIKFAKSVNFFNLYAIYLASITKIKCMKVSNIRLPD